MSVNGINSTNGATGAQVNASTLTPDALLAYCSASLNGIDDQIKSRMSDQQASVEQQKAAGEAISHLQTVTDGVKAGIPDEQAARTMAEGLITQYINTDDPALKKTLGEAYVKVTGKTMDFENGSPKVYAPGTLPLDKGNVKELSADQWNQMFVAPAKQEQDNMAKGSDIAMVEIQSLVSKRQLCIQLTTQMMQAANDGTKGVVGNIGR